MRFHNPYLRCILVAVLLLASVLLSVVLGSCGRSATEKRLEAISELVDEYPDSALTLLAAIDTTTLRPGRERALYDLDLTAARYFADLSTDFNRLERYEATFKKDTDRYKMLYDYLLGIHYSEICNYDKAIPFLLEASELAVNNNDMIYAGRAYRQLCDIYTFTQNPKEAVRYGELSLMAFKKYGRQDLIDWQLWSLGQALLNDDQYAKSLNCLEKAKTNANARNDRTLDPFVLSVEARVYMKKKDYSQAIEILKNKDFLDSLDYHTLSYCYYRLGNLDSAQYYMQNIRDVNPRSEMGFCLAEAYGDYPNACKILSEQYDRQTRDINALLKTNTALAETRYFQNKKKKTEQEYRSLCQTLVWAAIILGLVLLFAVFYYNRKKKIHKLRIRNYVLETINMERSISQIMNRYVGLSNEKKKMEQKYLDTIVRVTAQVKSEVDKRISLINNLYDNLYQVTSGRETSEEAKKSSTKRKPVSAEKLLKAIAKVSQSQEMSEDLESSVDMLSGGMMSKLKKELPAVYEKERRLFVYRSLSIHNSTIAYLMDSTTTAITVRTSKLKKKILNSNCPECKKLAEMLSGIVPLKEE